jgi:Yip1 domain
MQTEAIVSQAQDVLLKPKEAWTEIDKRPISIQDTYINYIAPLAAFPAVAHFLGMALIGVGSGEAGHREYVGFLPGLLFAVVSFGIALGAVYAFAYVTDHVGPQFGVARDFNRAFKLAAFFPTAAWLTGAIRIIPDLEMFWFLGAGYSLYLLFIAVPIVMKPPADKAFTYQMTVVAWGIILLLIVGLLLVVIAPGAAPRS